MKNFLEKLRQKDDAQKVALSFFTALILTFVIGSSWLTWSLSKDEKEVEKKDDTSEEVTPLSNLGSQAGELKSMFGDFIGQFNESKEILKAIPEVIDEQMQATTTSETTTTNSTTTLEIESSSE